MDRIHTLELNAKLIRNFSCGFPFDSYSAYVSNYITYEDFIGVAGFLYPELIKYKDCIFIVDDIKPEQYCFKTRFGDDRKTIERYNNLFCISDFWFQSIDNKTDSKNNFEIPNIEWQTKIAEIILYFWSRRIKELFPDIEFDFELHEEGLFDEDGLCLTFSQK